MDKWKVLNKTEVSGFAYILREIYTENKNILILFKDSKKVENFFTDLKALGPSILDNVHYFYSSGEFHPNIYTKTASILTLHLKEKGIIFVADAQSLKEYVIDREQLYFSHVSLKKNAKFRRDFLTDILNKYDYERVDRVEKRGEYSVRGGIIDFYPYSELHPIRVEFWGDVVESIRVFSEESQLTMKKLREKDIFLVHYKSSEDILLEELVKNKFAHVIVEGEDISPSFSYKEIFSFVPFFLETTGYKFIINNPPSFFGKIPLFVKEIHRLMEKNYSVNIFLSTEGLVERFTEIMEEYNLPFTIKSSFDPYDKGIINVIRKELSEGFFIEEKKLVVFTEKEVLGRRKRSKSLHPPTYPQRKRVTFSEFSPGDYVVHKDYGIGIYRGLIPLPSEEGEKEYIGVEYRDGDMLYISPQKLYLLKKYIGATPTLNKLKSGEWKKIKEKTKKEAQEVAKRLYELYTERSKRKGFAFLPDTLWQRELELSFPYNETEDQIKALEEVKRDMEKDVPMERIICGDVGYGKTEIAVRATFKAVESGKQVAFLVPTTILASQHYETFRERLSPFPVNIEMLSRFRSLKDQKKIVRKLKEGKIDIIIGTHRILQSDVKFKDLGLLIIDEEQRFGVMHKERLKELKKNIDVLVLTATPIPRTLYMALTGVRDLSLITTPPENRLSIKTFVYKKSNKIIKEAILHEINRGGQVFYVHNRIKDLDSIKLNLETLIPNLRVVIAHGQMDSYILEDILIDFWEGKYDVLLTTTIIEIGIDFPNANTIIIDDSYRYGLSQLYQLRGRVGRSHKKAYAYLLYPSYEKLTGNSKKRLEAIFEYQELGSGFNLALRDLEIRGAGSLLGKSQHGYNDVGMELYSEFIREEISDLKHITKGSIQKEFDPGIDYFIPSDYISSPDERIYYYNRFLTVSSKDELKSLKDELIDRFGRYKRDVKKIFDLVSLKLDAESVGFNKIVKVGNQLEFTKDGKEYKIDITDRSTEEILALIRNIVKKEIENDKKG